MGGWGYAGREAEVGAEAEAPGAGVGGVETGPGADAGGGAIGADDPAGRTAPDWPASVGAGCSEENRGVEGEADAEGGGAVAEELMEVGAAQAEAGEVGSWRRRGHWRRRRRFRRRGAFGIGGDAEGGEGAARFGHESFAAGLVDGGMASVGEEDVSAAEAEGDGGGESGRSGTGDEYVTVVVTHIALQSIVQMEYGILKGPPSFQFHFGIRSSLFRVPEVLFAATGWAFAVPSSFSVASPFEEEHFGVEAGAHGSEDAFGAGGGAAMFHDLVEYDEDGGGREIADAAEDLPRDLKVIAGEAEGLLVASRTLGPPVCMIQEPMSLRVRSCAARKSSTLGPRFSTMTLGTSGERTMLKPFSETDQPMTSSVLG